MEEKQISQAIALNLLQLEMSKIAREIRDDIDLEKDPYIKERLHKILETITN